MNCREEVSDPLKGTETQAYKGPVLGLSGSSLKWIAIVTMLIDHIGASLIEGYLMNTHGHSPYHGFASLTYDQMMGWYFLDLVLRCIGRIAFPIFCFLLVEGFLHTKNVKKYALRLGLFCILSEIPFDLAFRGEVFCWDYQNVFFTLLLALLGIWGMDVIQKKCNLFLGMLCVFGAAVAAELLHTDYGAFGVIFIALLYLFHSRKLLRNVLGAGMLLTYGGIEVVGALAFLPIAFYNGSRGRQPKYFFYAFYPVHLLLLAALGHWILPYFMH